MNAYEWGIKHGSCSEALDWRRNLGPDATQADAWRLCQRGDWLLWQLRRGLTSGEYDAINPQLQRALDRIVSRAIRRGFRAMRGVRSESASAWRRWARSWLCGEDRSEEAARAAEAAVPAVVEWAEVAAAAERAAAAAERAAERAERAAEWQRELLLQARDIRREIPEWPGKEKP